MRSVLDVGSKSCRLLCHSVLFIILLLPHCDIFVNNHEFLPRDQSTKEQVELYTSAQLLAPIDRKVKTRDY